VLELGGSDPFVVLDDADLALAAATAVRARFQNCGQSCIAAKRFVVVDAVADAFVARFVEGARAIVHGDPRDPATTLGPMARVDLRDALHAQVADAVAKGARPLLGAVQPDRAGAWYPATVLDGVAPGMRAWTEELFGPAASVVRVRDEAAALAAANATPYGLGGSVWTRDLARGERFARRLEAGMAFVNGMVKSDPRLPFGGVKESGFGRELGDEGLREFVNAQALWIGPAG
jgi:succinate-semialdehyde dehydrogenase/glutarate-semialdehyde dehydrogenase